MKMNYFLCVELIYRKNQCFKSNNNSYQFESDNKRN